MSYAIVKHKGTIYRILKQPFETSEQAMDRAWYIATHADDSVSFVELEQRSLQWMYEKYLGCK